MADSVIPSHDLSLFVITESAILKSQPYLQLAKDKHAQSNLSAGKIISSYTARTFLASTSGYKLCSYCSSWPNYC